jgi:DNA-binding MarR family transcriptional regulator
MLRSLASSDDRQSSPAVKLALALLRLEQALASGRAAIAGTQSLSPLQSQVLLDLLHGAGGDQTAAHLARRYGISAATLSDSLAVLARKRLLRAVPVRDDRRRRNLSLTRSGVRAAERAQARLDVLVRLTHELDPAVRATCLQAVIHLIRRCHDLGWIATDRMCVTCRFFVRDRAPNRPQPHFCQLIERPLGPGELRIDCPEHQLATPSKS